MEVDGAEAAAAETAAMGGDAELDGLECGHAAKLVIFWVGHARKRQRIERVEVLLCQWRSGRVYDDLPGALILGDRPAGRRGFGLIGKLEIHEFCVVGFERFARGQFDCIVRYGGAFDDAVGGAGNVVEVVEGAAGIEAAGDFEDGGFGHAVDEQVGLGVGEDGTLEFVGDVVVMGQPPERGLEAAEDDGDAFVGLSGTFGVDDQWTIGTEAEFGARAVGVFAAFVAHGSVGVKFGVDAAGGDGPEQSRRADGAEVVGGVPIGLGEDGDFKTVVREPTTDKCGPERRVIHISVRSDEDDVRLLPAEGSYFFACCGQKLDFHTRNRR